MKKFILGLAVALCATTAAKAEVTAAGSVDFVSSYTWRGIQQSGPAVQPGMSVSAGNFTFGTWGSMSFDESATTSKELDFTLGYEVGNFSISLTDYWWGGEMGTYGDRSHQQEITVGYGLDCGLSLAWSTMINGNADEDASGDQYYSSYLALGYSTEIADVVACDLSLGINPWDSQWGDCGISTIGVRFTKNVVETEKFALPLFVETSYSQVTDNAYLVAGFSFGF